MLADGSGFGSDAEHRIARSSGLGHGWSGTSGSYPTGTSGCRVYSPRVVVAQTTAPANALGIRSVWIYWERRRK